MKKERGKRNNRIDKAIGLMKEESFFILFQKGMGRLAFYDLIADAFVHYPSERQGNLVNKPYLQIGQGMYVVVQSPSFLIIQLHQHSFL